MSTIQQNVAKVILQKPISVTLGGRAYKVAPPSIGTLIEVSAMLGEMPELQLDPSDILGGVLRHARDSKYLTDICAMLVLGVREARVKPLKIIGKTRLERLSERLYRSATPEEIGIAVSEILTNLGVKDFFDISIFLQGLNVTKPTKMETTTEQTASGQ